MKRKIFLISLIVVLSLVLGACSPAAEEPVVEEPEVEEPVVEEPEVEEPVVEEPEVEEPVVEEPAGDKVQVRWFVGLGAGTDAPTIPLQQAVVDDFNASQDEIELVLEIVDNDVAYDTLATQIAAGNAPDIVGPVGIRGRDSFKGAWLDLAPYIEATDYDLSDYDPAMVDFYLVQEEGQLGIPFGISPSFMIYNFDLLDEAGLAYPPAQYGEPYVWADGTESEWNMDTLKELAMILTVDANGNDATMEEFDPENIVQFGFMNQFTDPRGVGTFFGAGNLVADDGVTAQIPEPWQAAWKWTYDGWWTDWFIPNGPYGGADFLQGGGGPFSSGNLAMIHIHTWYVAPWALSEADFEWDLGATPAYEGTITSKMHADTFGIPKGSKNPDAAFTVMTYMLSEEAAPKLLNIYGLMPARLSLQDAYFADYTEANFPGKTINWDVAVDSIAYADNPNHESWMPSFLETTDRYNEFWNYLANTPGLDVDAEMEVLLADLQTIFDAAQ
jgi:multiple sugar transport system substrate-binding protein